MSFSIFCESRVLCVASFSIFRESRELLVQVEVVLFLKRSNPGRIPFGDKGGDDYVEVGGCAVQSLIELNPLQVGKIANS